MGKMADICVSVSKSECKGRSPCVVALEILQGMDPELAYMVYPVSVVESSDGMGLRVTFKPKRGANGSDKDILAG